MDFSKIISALIVPLMNYFYTFCSFNTYFLKNLKLELIFTLANPCCTLNTRMYIIQKVFVLRCVFFNCEIWQSIASRSYLFNLINWIQTPFSLINLTQAKSLVTFYPRFLQKMHSRNRFINIINYLNCVIHSKNIVLPSSILNSSKWCKHFFHV